VVTAPSLDFRGQGSLRYAVSIDDQAPVMVDIDTSKSNAAWDKAVADNGRTLWARVHVDKPGLHVIKLWRVDPGVVFERVILDTGGLKPSYLGPPESKKSGAM
jgi:hypothetical protein